MNHAGLYLATGTKTGEQLAIILFMVLRGPGRQGEGKDEDKQRG